MGGSWSCLSCGLKLAIPASSTPLSNYRHNVSKPLEGQNSLRTIEEQIEHSKPHWSQLAQFEPDADEVAEVSNVEAFQIWKSHPKWGTFFHMFGKDGIGELVMGEKFAEGGQAELYDVKIHWNQPGANEEFLQLQKKWALKVFKKGTFLKQLQSQWPRGMFQDHVDRMAMVGRGELLQDRNINDMIFGTLLEDGRFAFLMAKEHEDLRQQIDCLMRTTSTNCCPYSKDDAELTMYQVALGMEWLHSHGIVHRDLKASNVLYVKYETGGGVCVIADFESSIGVVGTGLFRAPEILQACKDSKIKDKPELFTKAADVYSYGMVCYEILTGKLPFQGDMRGGFVHVLAGERPKVPEYVEGWMQELLRMCWQSNPVDRPSFRVILKLLASNSKICREVKAHIKRVESERVMLNQKNGHFRRRSSCSCFY